MIEHVWFDMGGTLYKENLDFKTVHDKHLYATYSKLVGEHDLEKAKQDYDVLYAEHGSNSVVFRALGQPSDFWHKAFDELDISSLLKPNAEISDTLAGVKKLVPISLFTNIKPETIKKVLTQLQIPIGDFTYIISGDDITERKPNLEGFHKMIELSGLPPAEVLYVGDRVDVDIKPAKQLGMATCLVWSSSPDADFSFSSFKSILSIVEDSRKL